MKSGLNFLSEELARLKKENLYVTMPVLSSQQSSRVIVNGKNVISLASNNYLGFANNPRLSNAAKQAIDKWGFGTGAVRMISGTMDIHLEMEQALAKFKHAEDVLVFVAGIAANRGTIQAMMGEGDVIISDELNHGSIIDGVRLTKSERKIFPHKNTAELEKVLKESQSFRRRLIVTDGVFSMDGDIAPLPEITRLAEEYDSIVMVDDAHGDGVLGKHGRGTVDHFNLHGKVDIEMGTMSKAFGCLGGYIAGRKELKDYLTQTARTFLFTTGHPPAVCAAIIEALKMVQEGGHVENLWKNTRYFKKGLQNLGFNTGNSETPITPVIVGDSGLALKLGDDLFSQGVFVKPIVYPLVAKDKARVRTIVTAIHTQDDLDTCLNAFEKSGKKLGII
ncbi:MAG: glycine C-acetyltransferase [Candidatus Aenigmarchaeota archaeon]|nr:glycine C-acetyltransferase [Candidatus Aenigmarchaeota archaeon]